MIALVRAAQDSLGRVVLTTFLTALVGAVANKLVEKCVERWVPPIKATTDASAEQRRRTM